ncbi:MAG: hypothetical protein AAGE89_03870 [Pseudomonadota bacterium]
MKKQIKTSTAVALAAALALGAGASNAFAQAGIFEVIHPDVSKGEVEIEALNGIGISDVEDGDERSVHEFAVGYGITDFWKFTVAVEVANPQGEGAEVEAFEIENLLLLPFFGNGHHHGEEKGDHDHDHGEFVLGFYTALEIPREDGISAGGIEFGPVWEAAVGPAEWVGNLFVEAPFEEGDPGIAYASQVVFPVSDNVGIGFENFGEFEGAFGDAAEQEHFAGPAVYFEFEPVKGHVLEPRAAVLFGLNDNSADAVLSINLEYKFGGKK